MAAATDVQRGFAVRCLFCGEEDTVRIQASDVHTLTCSGCDNEFSADDVRAELDRWRKLLAWLDTAPARD